MLETLKVEMFAISRTLFSFNANEWISVFLMITAGVIDAIGVIEADRVKDGEWMRLGVDIGEGVLKLLVVIDELVHEDKISRDRQSKQLMKKRFLDLLIWE